MCLAIPGDIVEIDKEAQSAIIDYNGLRKKASLMLCPQSKLGDTVLVHAGFVIQILDREYAAELKKLTEEAGLV